MSESSVEAQSVDLGFGDKVGLERREQVAGIYRNGPDDFDTNYSNHSIVADKHAHIGGDVEGWRYAVGSTTKRITPVCSVEEANIYSVRRKSFASHDLFHFHAGTLEAASTAGEEAIPRRVTSANFHHLSASGQDPC